MLDDIKRALNNTVGASYNCISFNVYQASTPIYLKNHIRTVHLEEVHTLTCPACEYTSDRSSDLEAHVEMEHPKRLVAAVGMGALSAAAAADRRGLAID